MEREKNTHLNVLKKRYNVVQGRRNGETGKRCRICLVRSDGDIATTVFVYLT
jgi:hypothetical protein